MDITQVMVEFRILGDDFNPDIFTSALSVEPTNSWKKGDEYINQTNLLSIKKSSCWTLSSGRENSLDMGKQIYQVLDKLIGKEEKLINLKSIYDIDYTIDVVIEVENGDTPAIYLESKSIKFANDIGATFDFDMYVYSI